MSGAGRTYPPHAHCADNGEQGTDNINYNCHWIISPLAF